MKRPLYRFGPDGATHAGNLDLSFLRCVPNMVVMAAADEDECRKMLTTGFRHEGPAAVRYPRGTGPGVEIQRERAAGPDRTRAMDARHWSNIAASALNDRGTGSGRLGT